MMIEQTEYYKFYDETAPEILGIYDCNGEIVDGEKIIIEGKIKPKSILDIGCGAGRLFDYYSSLNINFLGIEKSINWIQSSKHKSKILNLDITDEFLVEKINSHVKANNIIQFDLVVLLGGTISAFVDPMIRKKAWDNIGKLIEPNSYLVICTLVDFEWYETNTEGRMVRLLNQLPFQYLYSKMELENIFSVRNLEIDEVLEYPNVIENFNQMKALYIILKKRN